MLPKLINTETYTKEYPDDTRITAKDAKEIFFLTTHDLRYLNFERPKGFMAYAMKSGSCKYFNLQEVKRIAIDKLGSISALVKKAEALNQRRRNKVDRDKRKREEAERQRQEAAAAAERQRKADLEAKKRAREEKKRLAEQQAKDADSWRALVKAVDGTGVVLHQDATSLATLLHDIHEWKKSQASSTTATAVKTSTNVGTTTTEVTPNRLEL